MSQDLIATWLGLEPGDWPPDHYRLLGLKRGETNANLIEERVHQRLDTVRRYQMMYPDQATEAMNLIAQAFVCLTDPAAKKVYDLGQGVNGTPATVAGIAAGPPLAQVATVADTAEVDEPVVVLYNPTDDVKPPPVIVAYDETIQPPVALIATEEAPAVPLPAAIPVEVPVPHLPPPPPAAPTRRALRRPLYKRMARVRKLLDHWNAAGVYIGSPKRRLTRPAEAKDFLHHLAAIRVLLPELPPLLGQAGQAGYHVVTLAQLNSVPTFQTLEPQQREVLNRDWNDGIYVLEEHRAALRKEIRASRRQSGLQRAGRAAVRLVTGHPGVGLVLLALLSLILVLFRTFVYDWLPRGH